MLIREFAAVLIKCEKCEKIAIFLNRKGVFFVALCYNSTPAVDFRAIFTQKYSKLILSPTRGYPDAGSASVHRGIHNARTRR